MEARHIQQYGSQIPCFLGVFQLSDLAVLNVVKNNVSFIVIHDNHAIAVNITSTTIDVMDPLGPSNFNTIRPICEFLAIHLPCKLLQMNSKLQSDTSEKCAVFCLLFLFMRCNNYSFQEAVNVFTCDYIDNDRISQEMFNLFFIPVSE